SQFQYFSGNNAAVLTFAWPSPGHIFGHFADKRRSGEAAADLALSIELLAEHSIAERINLLAYSAGGRTVARALELLGARHHDPSSLRLGQVYLTQSDQPMEEFLSGLPAYFDLLEAMNVTIAKGDAVLQMAALTDLKVRAGSVGEGQKMNLSPEIAERLEEIMRSKRMVIIDLKDVAAEDYRFSHGAWYESSWVSTDVMIALLGGLSAEERGLESREVPGAVVWRFPPQYIETLEADIEAWRREQDRLTDQAGEPAAESNLDH
ncbi:MAG: alpha/beta hydrolase, partial [Gammaproteobacteria bacterium]